ncbi:hypothetical protein T492DRAFT_885968 [Pavlovales sp. CCMP2436]|nr:hypothetical protein T492DRAFT_885968 [Pavlovales sp. CCMP2436]
MAALELSEALIREQLDAEAGEEPHTVFEITLHNRGLERIGRALGACAKLRVLDLSFNRLETVDGLQVLTELRELRLYCNRISRLGGLGGCTSLQVLQLHGNQLGEEPLGPSFGRDDGLAKLSALHSITLDRNPLTDRGLAALQLGKNAALAMVRLSGTRISSLAPLSRCAKLESIEANANEITSLEGVTGGWPALTELQLSGNRISDLRPLRPLKRLAVLHLNDNALRSLRGLPPLPVLVELQLASNLLESLVALGAPPAAKPATASAGESGGRAGPSRADPPRPGVRPGSRTGPAASAQPTRAGADEKGEADAGNPLCSDANLVLLLSYALGERLRILNDLSVAESSGYDFIRPGTPLASRLGARAR